MKTIAFVFIAAFFGVGFGFLLAAATGASLGGHDHSSHDRGAPMRGHDDGGPHAHGEATDLPGGPGAPTLDFVLHREASGWSLQVLTENFRFAPENANGPHVAGEGHAHVYVDGAKLARLYGPWFHIPPLPGTARTLTVTLNGNDHSPLSVGGKALSLSCALPDCGRRAPTGQGR